MSPLARELRQLMRRLHTGARITAAMEQGERPDELVARLLAEAARERGRALTARERGDLEVQLRQQWHLMQTAWPQALPPRPLPTPVCSLCLGAGRVRRDLFAISRGGELHLRSDPCPLCHAADQARRLQGTWPLPVALQQMARQPVSARADAPHLRRAIERARAFRETWPAGVLFALSGGYGSGKTHLLAKLYAAAWAASISAIYTTAPELEKLFTSFEASRLDTLPPEESAPLMQRRRDLVEVDLLLLDEADRYSKRAMRDGWVERQLFELLSRREIAARSTVLAGNSLGDPEHGLHPGIIDRAQASGYQWWVSLGDTTSARPLVTRGSASLLDKLRERRSNP